MICIKEKGYSDAVSPLPSKNKNEVLHDKDARQELLRGSLDAEMIVLGGGHKGYGSVAR